MSVEGLVNIGLGLMSVAVILVIAVCFGGYNDK